MIAAATLVVGVGIVRIVTRPPSLRQQLFELTKEIAVLRDSAQACRAALEVEQDSFAAYGGRLDSMRSRLESIDRLHPDGVVFDSFDVYVETVDSFNAALPEWAPAADSINAHRALCESAIGAHNTLVDSARTLRVEMERRDRGGG
jgi:hypothetical protein